MNVQTLNVAQITATPHDIERVEGLRWNGRSFFGNNSPFPGKVTTMAKVIKDPVKLVQRTKAIVQIYGCREWCGMADMGRKQYPSHPWQTFSKRLYELGFTREQVEAIRKTSISD